MEKIWLESYDPGVQHDIDQEEILSLIDVIERSFLRYGEKAAFINDDRSISFDELDKLTKAFSGFLIGKCELLKGDRVVLMMPNILQLPIVMLGTLRVGMIPVCINPHYTAHELKMIVDDSGAKCVVILENYAHLLQKVLEEKPIQHVVILKMGDLFESFKRKMINFHAKYIKKVVPSWNIPQAVFFKESIDKKHEKYFKRVEVDLEEVAILQYTGGITSDTKGVMLTHRNVTSSILQMSAWAIEFFKKQQESIIVNALPMYYTFSLMANGFLFFSKGYTNLLITHPGNISLFVKELKKYKFSVFFGVNTLFRSLLNNKNFCKLDFSNLRYSVSGGMAVQRGVANKWKKITGNILLQGYGLTETTSVVSINPVSSHELFNGNIGLPLPSTDIKICNSQGKECPIGEVGELYVKGPQVMKGYWNKLDKTKEVLSDQGWLQTGDFARIDKKGFIQIIGRKSDVIIVSGLNVYPEEIEETILKMKGISEVAVVGKKVHANSDIIKAYIVKKDPQLSSEDIMKECRENLMHYKIPNEIEFRKILPKSSIGKVIRRLLREEKNSV